MGYGAGGSDLLFEEDLLLAPARLGRFFEQSAPSFSRNILLTQVLVLFFPAINEQ
jgi:hypothetical protein